MAISDKTRETRELIPKSCKIELKSNSYFFPLLFPSFLLPFPPILPLLPFFRQNDLRLQHEKNAGMVACLLKMSGREGCLTILLDKSVKHYDLAQNRIFIDLNDGNVQADVFGCNCYIYVRKS